MLARLAGMDGLGLCFLASVMHCLTARLLLFFLLASAFAPVLQALSAEPPHACCLRKLHGSAERGAGIHDSAKHDGNCCPPMTTPHSAQVLVGGVAVFNPHTSQLSSEPENATYAAEFANQNSSRAPPACL
jgi:hypothetical protein